MDFLDLKSTTSTRYSCTQKLKKKKEADAENKKNKNRKTFYSNSIL